MARMIDTLMEPGAKIAYCPGGKHVRAPMFEAEFLRQNRDAMEVIVADNVAEWVNKHAYNKQIDLAKDFPCIAPPFDLFWIEMHQPADFLHDRHRDGLDVPHTIGGLFFANRREEWLALPSKPSWARWAALGETVMPELAIATCHEHADAAWVMLSVPYVQYPAAPGEAVPMHAHFSPSIIAIRADGSVVKHPSAFVGGVKDDPTYTEADVKNASATVNQHLYYMFAALAFLNCKNVESPEIRPSAKLNKRRVERGKQPLVTYRVLGIAQMGERLRTEGRVGTEGLQMALHLCRGHWKTFKPDKPLFGKHVGTYAWANAAKGDAAHGIRVKDYVLTDAQRYAAEQDVVNPGTLARAAELIRMKERQRARKPRN